MHSKYDAKESAPFHASHVARMLLAYFWECVGVGALVSWITLFLLKRTSPIDKDMSTNSTYL